MEDYDTATPQRCDRQDSDRHVPKSSAIKGESEKSPSPPTSSPMWPGQGRAVSRENPAPRELCIQKCQ